MKRTKFDDLYIKLFGEPMGCLFGIPLMFVIGFVLLYHLMVWRMPDWMLLVGGCLVVFGTQIFFAHMNQREKHFTNERHYENQRSRRKMK